MQELTATKARLPRVLIADDHIIVAEGLRKLLGETCDVIGVVTDGRQLLAEAPRVKPDLIVLDVSMPFLNGLQAAEKLKEVLPEVKLVFLTMNEDPNVAAAALKFGNVGYVLKNSAIAELQKAVSAVLKGKSYVTAKMKPDNWAVSEERAQRVSKELTQRQMEVLPLLAEGRPMKEIAHILQVSEKTVEFHKYHIMEMHNLKNNAELVLFAIRKNVISS